MITRLHEGALHRKEPAAAKHETKQEAAAMPFAEALAEESTPNAADQAANERSGAPAHKKGEAIPADLQAALIAMINRQIELEPHAPPPETSETSETSAPGAELDLEPTLPKQLATASELPSERPIPNEATRPTPAKRIDESTQPEKRSAQNAVAPPSADDEDYDSISIEQDPSSTGQFDAIKPLVPERGGHDAHEPASIPTPVVEEPWLRARAGVAPTAAAELMTRNVTPARPLPLPLATPASVDARHHELIQQLGPLDPLKEIGEPEPIERIRGGRATFEVGDGADKVQLHVSAQGGHVRVEATMASAELAQHFSDHRRELERALEQHGMQLGALDAQVAGQRSGNSSAEDTNRSSPRRSDGNTSTDDEQPITTLTRAGVRVVA